MTAGLDLTAPITCPHCETRGRNKYRGTDVVAYVVAGLKLLHHFHCLQCHRAWDATQDFDPDSDSDLPQAVKFRTVF